MIVNPYLVQPSIIIPAIPPFNDITNCWSTFNWNPDSYLGRSLFYTDDIDHPFGTNFDASAPFPTNWDLENDGGSPYLLNIWYDQNSILDLIQSGSNRPILDSTSQLISFNGVSHGLQGSNPLFSSTPTGTIYILFKAGSLIETSILLETGTGANDAINRISIRLMAGVFTFSVYDRTGLVALPNTKIKTISDNNWHLAACTFDADNAIPENQTGLKIDNSTSGVTSPASADLGGSVIGADMPNIGARNNAESAFFTGSMRTIIAKTVVDNAVTQDDYWDRIQYLQSVSP